MKLETDEDRKEAAKANKKPSFFQSLFGSLFSSSSPEADKKRKLKQIGKNYLKCKYHTFYKPASSEVLPPFAKFFYEIYKIISPAQILFKSNPNAAAFKSQIINYCMSDHQIELLSHFEEQKIKEVARQISIDKISAQIEEELNQFSNEFDNERAGKTENIYKAFTLFKDFCSFDFYVLLRKFSSKIQENNFSQTPVFEKINAEYIVDDLKDFVTVAYLITDDSIEWNSFFTYLKETRGNETVSAGTWKKIVAKLKSIQASGAFDLMIKHISQNPGYTTEIHHNYETIIEPYIDKLQEETMSYIATIANAQKASKANSLCEQIFESLQIQEMKNYTTAYNSVFEKKDLDLFMYSEPLGYLKTFIIEFVKKDVREFFDVVVVRGAWDTSLAAPMSNAYQELLKTSDAITKFDDLLAEDGGLGIKIKTLLPKTAHDPGAENIINRVISDSNEQAKKFLIESTQNLIQIGKTLKQLIEDYLKSKPVLVQNWKELERFIDHPMKEFSVNIYKKIYLFVQLMQQYLKD